MLRADARLGDCFRYKPDSDGYKSGKQLNYIITTNNKSGYLIIPDDLPEKWAPAREGNGNRFSEIELIPHYKTKNMISAECAIVRLMHVQRDADRGEPRVYVKKTLLHTGLTYFVRADNGVIYLSPEDLLLARAQW